MTAPVLTRYPIDAAAARRRRRRIAVVVADRRERSGARLPRPDAPGDHRGEARHAQ